jgi:hypothetical protein
MARLTPVPAMATSVKTLSCYCSGREVTLRRAFGGPPAKTNAPTLKVAQLVVLERRREKRDSIIHCIMRLEATAYPTSPCGTRPIDLFLLLLQVFLHGLVRVLDCETPDIQVVTDGPDDIHDEAAVNTYTQSQAHEDESDLIDTVA